MCGDLLINLKGKHSFDHEDITDGNVATQLLKAMMQDTGESTSSKQFRFLRAQACCSLREELSEK